MAFSDVLAEAGVSVVVAGVAIGPGNKLFVAIDALVHARDGGASTLIAIDLTAKKPTYEVLHEAERTAHGYRYDARTGAHAILQHAGVTIIERDQERFVGTKLALRDIARLDRTWLACSADGEVVRIDDGKVAKLSNASEPLAAVCIADTRAYLGGGWGSFLTGDANKLAPVDLPTSAFQVEGKDDSNRHAICGLHAKADGTILIGCRDMNAVYADGEITRLRFNGKGTYTSSVTEHAGTEYWAVEHHDTVVLYTRAGAKLTAKLRAKWKRIYYRKRPFRNTAMASNGDVLAIAIGGVVHVLANGKWFQLKIAAVPGELVKRAPAAMKHV